MSPSWPRPALLATLPARGHAVIEASAGTGKTYTIEHLVVDRLLAGIPLEQILVVTFTEKATAELQARIRQLIERVLTAPPPAPDAPPPDPETHWILDAAARQRLDAALFGFDRASIYTIHGLCHRILQELAFESGQLFEQEIIDSTRVFNRAFREILRTRLATDPDHKALLGRWLADGSTVAELEQLLRTAWFQRYPGKQPPLEAELTALLDTLAATLDPGAIATDYAGTALTQPALQAADQALRALAQALRPPPPAPSEAPPDEAPPDEAPPDEAPPPARAPAERLAAALRVDLKAILHPRRAASHGKRRFPDELGEASRQLRARLERLRVLAALSDSVERAVVDAFLPALAAQVERNKRRDGQLDYDDLLRRVWQAVHAPGGEALISALRARYQTALIDEFQDTDDLQWDIFHRIFAAGTTEHSLIIIGDPKQAIYGFRGADVYTYLRACETLLAAGAVRRPLATNHRSSPAIIRALNLLFDQAAPAPLFSGQIQYREPAVAGQTAWGLSNAAGHPLAPVVLWQLDPPPPGRNNRDQVPKYQLQGPYAAALARSLRDLIEDPAGIWIDDPKGRRRLRAGDVFVLVRGQYDALDAAEALGAAGVPYAFYKQEGLFQSAEAHDLRDVLAAVADPHDRGKRLKAFATPLFAVPWQDLAGYRDLPGGHPLVERLHTWRQLGEQERYARLFHHLLHRSGLVERALFLGDDARALTNYQHILEQLLEAATARRLSLAETVELLQRYIDRQESPEGPDPNVQRLTGEADAVQIMTVHKSKGLEAPVVCLFGGFGPRPKSLVNVIHDPDLEPGGARRILIGAAARDAAADALERALRQEDERLIYVALTRARGRLYLPLLDTRRKVSGSFFEPLKERLHTLHAAGALPPELFHLEPVDAEARPRARPQPQLEPISAWRPPPALLAQEDDAARFAALRARHAPLLITSYTRIKAEAEARPGAALDAPIEADEFHTDADEVQPALRDEHTLPGGRHMGRFLHEAIEALDLTTAFADRSYPDFRDDPVVCEHFDRALGRHGIDPRWREPAQQLIWRTLTTPIALGEAPPLQALWRPRHLIEMELLYPIPEPGHALLAGGGQGFTVERGYIKGYVDYLFEHDGKIYVLDWKSDTLADYGPAALDRHVQAHYQLQAELYTIGILRWLKVRDPQRYAQRFGGLLYVFLRGVGPDGAGVWFHRPAFAQVIEWEQRLLQDPLAPAPVEDPGDRSAIFSDDTQLG